jgi:hypothetical protein
MNRILLYPNPVSVEEYQLCNRKIKSFCFFVYWFTSRSRIFHLYGDIIIAGVWLQNLGLVYSVARAFQPWGIFITLHMLLYGVYLFPISFVGTPHTVATYDTQRDLKNLLVFQLNHLGKKLETRWVYVVIATSPTVWYFSRLSDLLDERRKPKRSLIIFTSYTD